MGIPILVMGDSGSGKTTSLRNCNPDDLILIQSISKALPFRHNFTPWDSQSRAGSIIVTDRSHDICKAIDVFPNYGKDVIIVDDFQYTMANEFMRRSSEKGFDKFTEIARNAWNIVMAAQAAPPHVRVYFLTHTETSDRGQTKIKTIGKMLDEKITLEGMFTIVMRSMRLDGEYVFSTQTNGYDTVKTPMDLFSTETIENDLNTVDQSIKNFYRL